MEIQEAVEILSSLTSPPEGMSPSQYRELVALESQGDAELDRLMRGIFPIDRYERFDDLRRKRRERSLDASEQAEYDRLSAEAELLTLRKAYAAVLLKWRGCKLPTDAELEAEFNRQWWGPPGEAGAAD